MFKTLAYIKNYKIFLRAIENQSRGSLRSKLELKVSQESNGICIGFVTASHNPLYEQPEVVVTSTCSSFFFPSYSISKPSQN